MNLKSIIAASALLFSFQAFGQTDTTATTIVKEEQDTVRVGNFIIVKKEKKEDNSRSKFLTIRLTGNKKKEKSNISTNWIIFDLGFANLRDETDYGAASASGFLQQVGPKAAPGKNDLKLNGGKSSNVNIWIFMQKLNVSKNILNLKYGLGLEMYNFRYDKNITYHKDPVYIFTDSVNFSKNKLYAGYLTVPFMINVDATPDKKRGFSFSAGLSAGYLVGSHTKQISKERGKDKTKGAFNLNPWRLAAIGEIALGPVRLYGSYSFNELMENGLKQYPYAVGIRFSNW